MTPWKYLVAVVLAGLLPAMAQAALFDRLPTDFQAEAKTAGREGKQLAIFNEVEAIHGGITTAVDCTAAPLRAPGPTRAKRVAAVKIRVIREIRG